MLLCDRCKKPIVGESKKLLDVCPECYDQVMNYIVAGNTNVGVTRARVVARIARRFPLKVAGVIAILLIFLSITTYFAYTAYTQYEAPFQTEKSLVNYLERNMTQEQATIQTWASIILQDRAMNANLTTQVNTLNQNLATDNQNITAQQAMIVSLRSQSLQLNNTVSILRDNISTLKDHTNTFVIWNVPVNVSAGYFLFESVPDTFDYHDNFTATAPVSVYYFNSTQFVQWYLKEPPSGNYTKYLNTMGESDTFTLAEGCGGYVAIYYFPIGGTIRPNISATYNPATQTTGSCSSS